MLSTFICCFTHAWNRAKGKWQAFLFLDSKQAAFTWCRIKGRVQTWKVKRKGKSKEQIRDQKKKKNLGKKIFKRERRIKSNTWSKRERNWICKNKLRLVTGSQECSEEPRGSKTWSLPAWVAATTTSSTPVPAGRNSPHPAAASASSWASKQG